MELKYQKDLKQKNAEIDQKVKKEKAEYQK
jgi:hypothetical protein